MNTYIKSILLCLIFVCLVYIFCFVKQQLAMIANVLENDFECGKPKCDLNFNKNLPVSLPAVTDDLSLTSETIAFHKSLINFMASVVYYSLEGKDYVPLTNMTTLKQVNTQSDKLMSIVTKINDVNNILIVGTRGTQNLSDLMEDTHLAQVEFPVQNLHLYFNDGNKPMCHQGFFNVFNQVKDQVLQILNQELKNINQVVLVGHSLGAAVSCLLGITIKMLYPSLQVNVVTYACPRIGNKDICDLIDSNLQHIRFRNDSDAVPTFPSAVSANEEDPTQPWFYYHSGEQVVFNANWKSVLNNHLIPVYQSFVNSL